MELSRLLEIQRGITAVIGAGGKTSLIYALAKELGMGGRVICTTTTRIYPPAHMPVLYDPGRLEILAAQAEASCLCVGTPAAEGKLTAPAMTMGELAELCDYVLVEADGSKRLPVKAHASHEPVIPAGTRETILVVGASSFGRPVAETVHRPGIFCRLTAAAPGDAVTPENLAALFCVEGLGNRLFINQVETEERRQLARRLAALMDCPVTAGTLWKGVFERCK